ncbi:esterase/lipase family protein [Turneriella parva]|uniref:esterase/lipase family protein n=1 Tax=Turneriella parva TaxID=29510 RepID=UPI0002DCFE17|nr:alpha/beta hydrolase [Turneriella parva]
MWREAAVALELANLALRYPALTRGKRPFNHPVILFPGFGTDEVAMTVLHHYLKTIGAEVHHWGLGRNHGYVPDLLAQAIQRLKEFTADGLQVHLVGWSLGGYIAREVARELPEQVAHVVTLGSPVVGGPKFTAVGELYKSWGFDLEAMARDVEMRSAVPIKNAILAIYSKADAVVDWRACIDQRSPNVTHAEVSGSHLGLVVNAKAFELVRDFLSA